MSWRSLLLPSTLALALPALTACGGIGPDAGGDTGPGSGSSGAVVAAFYPLAWASEQVAGDGFEVTNLTAPGAEPHDLELSIRQTAEVAAADLVVFEHGLQPAVDAAVAEHGPDARVDAAEVVELQPVHEHEGEHRDEHGDAHEGEHGSEGEAEHESEGEHEGDHEHEHEHAVDGLDPHFWLDPLLLADVGDAVTEQLSDLDPDRAEDYRSNAETLRAELTALDEEYATGLADCARDTVVVSHDAFGYLSKYGLHVESVLGLSPNAEPTAATLESLGALIEEEGIATVFGEALAGTKTADALADSVGVEVAVLDPLEGLTSADDTEDYLSLMRSNLAALRKANDCA